MCKHRLIRNICECNGSAIVHIDILFGICCSEQSHNHNIRQIIALPIFYQEVDEEDDPSDDSHAAEGHSDSVMLKK